MNEIVDRLPPPPMLHWDERESDRYFGQLPLSGFEDVPVMAERVFIRLARRWHDVFSTAGSHDTPPRLADELALACLMLAREHDEEFTVVPRVQQERNIVQACRRAVFVWVDSMPWRIMQRDRWVGVGTTLWESLASQFRPENLGNGIGLGMSVLNWTRKGAPTPA